MYKDFPKIFIKPLEDAKIWRYMDFPKFLDLITRVKLYFPRADKLDDPYEGSYPRANVKLRKVTYPAMSETDLAGLSDFFRMFRRFTVINCWHLNESESDAMWKLYLKSGKGVAIQSTFNRLKESFTDSKYTQYIGKVTYLDYDTEIIKREGQLSPFVHKRISFEHEHELRVVIQHFYHNKNGDINYFKSPFKDGIAINVNLNKLIQRIYLAPTCPDWHLELVKSITKKYKINVEKIIKSPLYDTRRIQF